MSSVKHVHLTGVDDDFVHVFGRLRGGKAMPKPHHQSVAAEGEGDGDDGQRLRPPERRIASAIRSHARAVKSVVKQNELCRDVALSGLMALRDAERVTAEGSAAAASSSAEAVIGAVSSVSVPVITVDLAFEAAMAAERDYHIQAAEHGTESVSDEQRLRAWALVYGVAAAILANKNNSSSSSSSSSSTEKSGDTCNAARRAQLSALSYQASIFATRGESRKAIGALEKIFACARADTIFATSVAGHLAQVARRLARLHDSVGGIDATRKCLLLEAQWKAVATGEAIDGEGLPDDEAAAAAVSTATTAATATSTTSPVKSTKGGGGGVPVSTSKTVVASVSLKAPKPTLAPLPVSTTTTTTTAPPAAVVAVAVAPPLTHTVPPTVAPAPKLNLPTFPDDGTPFSLVSTAIVAAMVRHRHVCCWEEVYN